MDPKPLENYLHEHIPLSKAMGVEVRSASREAVTLAAPLAPNINHRETVFGGSASAVAILAAWSLLYVRLEAEDMGKRIVIHSNTVEYNKPIRGDFLAIAQAPDAAAWMRLLAALKRNRMARITVRSRLECSGADVGGFEGEFVVMPSVGRKQK
jgi:thioesterase domain-containing protein